MNGRTTKYVITAALSASLVFAGTPSIALGESSDKLQAQLSEAQEHLGVLYDKAEAASEELNEAKYQLGETKANIEKNTQVAAQKETELAKESEVLSGIVAEDYKNGGVSLASILLGSHSVGEMVDTVYALNKVSERKQEVIQTVKTTRDELNAARDQLQKDEAKQEELVVQCEEYSASLQSSVNEAQAYANGLSAELQQALAKEEAARQEAAKQEAARAEAARQAEAQKAEQEARAAAQAQQEQQQKAQQEQQAQQQAQQQQEQQAQQQDQQQEQQQEQQAQPQEPEQAPQEERNEEPSNNEQSNQNESTPERNEEQQQQQESNYESSETQTNNGGGGSSVASAVVAAALSQVGVDYVYGTCNPGVSFDCSGLVMYCYECVGISLPHSSESQSVYCNKPASQAVAGDIVWRSGHVGICIGDGKTVEAFMPGMGVGIGSVSSFVSAGSPA